MGHLETTDGIAAQRHFMHGFGIFFRRTARALTVRAGAKIPHPERAARNKHQIAGDALQVVC